MKLSEIKGEKAIETVSDLLDPICEICADPEIMAMYHSKKASKLQLVKLLLKKHAKSVQDVIAILDGEDPAVYQCNLLTLPIKLIEVLNDPQVVSLFPSAQTEETAESSPSAPENTEESRQ